MDEKSEIIKSFIEDLPPEMKKEDRLAFNKECFVWYKNEDIANDYEITDPLGQGSFGVVLKGKHKQTGDERALKVIPRSKITRKIERFINEVNALKKLDHPNVIRLYEVYETETDVILVQELCKGGELLKRFENYDSVDEHKIAKVFKQILMAIEYCHQNHIAHRDLKPENFMFTSEKEEAKIKLIDFGLATMPWEDDKSKSSLNVIKSRVGTIMFMAPEVIKQKYDWKWDLWSAGVILYILVWGYPPFYGDTEYDTVSKILDFDFNYDHDIWKIVSPELRDMINHLLAPQEDRYTAEDALDHDWIYMHDQQDALLAKELPACYKRVMEFKTHKEIKKILLTYFITRVQDSQIMDEQGLFEMIDKNQDGVLSIEELKQGLGVTSSEIRPLFETLDADKNGKIEYTEWMAAAKDWSGGITPERIKDAFTAFDLNSDGYIDWKDLKEVLVAGQDTDAQTSKLWKDMILEVDSDGDGKVKLDDFMTLFESKLNIS